MKKELEIRDGEAILIDKLFESENLHEVVQEAMRMGLTFDRLTTDSVKKDGPWKSTAESTIPASILYLKQGKSHDHLITQRSEEENYALFTYQWNF